MSGRYYFGIRGGVNEVGFFYTRHARYVAFQIDLPGVWVVLFHFLCFSRMGLHLDIILF